MKSRPPTHTPAHFYEAIGLAIAQWSRVEDALCDLFCRLVVCSLTGAGFGKPEGEGVFILGNTFYSITNLNGRLALINYIMGRLVRDDGLLTEWNAIQNKAANLYKRRNVLAHGTPWAGEKSDPEFVRYSIFAMNNRIFMNYERICAATPSFARFAERITKLAIDVNAHFARRERHPKNGAH